MTAVPMQLLADGEREGVRERRFNLDRDGRRVPGIVWTPTGADSAAPTGADSAAPTGADSAAPTGAVSAAPTGAVSAAPTGAVSARPLVLLGHGASGHKRQDYVVSMARRLVRHRGFAAASIDGPVHGDRRGPDAEMGSRAVFLHFAQTWSSDDRMTDEMVADYGATVDAVQSLEGVGVGPVGWWGLSMGTILGLPFVAAEPRIGAAVLGLMGMTGPTRARIEADAPKVTCPVLFLVQWDDDLFARDTAFTLFDALGSKDKRLHASVGTHGAVPEEEFVASEGFLARQLGDGVQ